MFQRLNVIPVELFQRSTVRKRTLMIYDVEHESIEFDRANCRSFFFFILLERI